MPTASPSQQIVRRLVVGSMARGLPIVFNALPGIVGTPGPPGPPGPAAFTDLVNPFVMPQVATQVNVTVKDTSWMVAGASIYIERAGYFTVQSIFDATHCTVTNSGAPGNVSAGTIVTSGGGITAAGSQGGQGVQGVPGNTGPVGPAGPQGTGVTWRDVYNVATNYAVNDAVSYGGSSYVALKTNVGVTPGTDPTTWSLFAAQGQTGAAGQQGPQGIPGQTGATGPAGPASTTTTTSSFTQPNVNALATVAVANSGWIPPGSVIYIQGAGYYIVSSVPDATHVIVQNTGWTGNVTPGTVISSAALVAAGGVQGANGATGSTGPVGPQGNPGAAGAKAYSILQASFVMPQSGSTVPVQVDDSTWLTQGLNIFVQGAGYFQVQSVVGTTSAVLTNLGYSGNASPGTTIPSGGYLYAGGAPQTINREYFATDFENGWQDWTVVNTGGTVTPGGQVDPDSQGIAVLQANAAVNTTGVYLTLGNGMTGTTAWATVQTGNRQTFFHAKVQLPTLSTGTDTFAAYFGWQSQAAVNTFQDGIFFYYSSAGSTPGKWGCYVRKGGTQNFVDSGVTVATGTWYDLSVTIDAAFVTFAIASYATGATPVAPVQVAQIARSLAPVAGNGLAPVFNVVKSVGTTVTPRLYVDAYEHEILYAGATKFRNPALVGPKGTNAYTGTSNDFVTPNVGANLAITVADTTWMSPGQILYIAGAGAYSVVSIADPTHVTVQNLGSTGNAAPSTLISAGAKVAASGVAGPQGVIGPQGIQGPVGQTASTSLSASFVQPAVNATVNAQVLDSSWIAQGQIVYVENGGYYSVQNVPNQQNITLSNLGYSGSAAPAATVPTSGKVSPAGFAGPQGSGPAPVGATYFYPSTLSLAGCLPMDGRAISRTTYPQCFTLLGVNFGSGDGSTTFNLPDMRGRVPVGLGTGTGLNTYNLGDTGGEEEHILTIAELAVHSHTASAGTHGHTTTTPNHNHPMNDGGHAHTVSNAAVTPWGAQAGGATLYLPAAQNTTSNGTGVSTQAVAQTITTAAAGIGAITVANQGSGSGHNNLQPYLAMQWIMKVVQEVSTGPVVPLADTTQDGLLRKVSGLATDYIGGDNTAHDLPTAVRNAISLIQVRNFNSLGNPNFEIDQRTVGAGTNVNTAFALDRWSIGKTGTLVGLAEQVAATPTILLPGTNFGITQNFLRVVVNTAQASLGTGDYYFITQSVEGVRLRELISDVHSFSLLVRSSVAGLKFGITLRSGSPYYSLTKLCTIPTANAWTVITLPALPIWSPSATWPLNPGGLGYYLYISLAAGATYMTPANDAWQAGNFFGAIGQSNFFANAVNSTLDIAMIQHEPGSVCNPFQDLPWVDNLVACTRYWQKTYDYATAVATLTNPGMVGGTSIATAAQVRPGISFVTRMAKVPTVTVYSPAVAGANLAMNTTAGTNPAVTTTGNVGEAGFAVNATAAPTGSSSWQYHYIADTGW